MNAVHEGLIIANHGYRLVIETVDGRSIPGTSRKSLGSVVCGDHVQWQASADGAGVVIAVHPRTAMLARPDQRGIAKPVCANLDQIAVVGLMQPDSGVLTTSERARIDAYLAAAEMLSIDALLIINKIDLLTPVATAHAQKKLTPYRDAGYKVILTSARSAAGMGTGMDELRAHLAGKRSVLVGESGAGKSSLTQLLLPDRDIRIGELSTRLERGKHTTTVAMLFRLPGGGDIIDSPGVREFHLGTVEPSALAHAFREFRPHLGNCRYRDCRHLSEPDCALSEAATAGQLSPERLESYRAIVLGDGRRSRHSGD
ncbi:MAG: ribosome small subunit-dependent GTPase A [Chromatiales bacterium]|jgi:ribosome biogenesis GTPase|nr:ribosome small subunit-dependent GTPase A [Chromatiales bacterium]